MVLDSTRDIEDLEIDLLLEAVFQRHGLDFRGWLREPLRRKLHGFMQAAGLDTVSAVQERLLHDPRAAAQLLRTLSRSSGALFGDVQHFQGLRGALVPWLRSRPAPRLWVAECSAADVFALAILLQEEDLYERTQIFATHANEDLLAEAAAAGMDVARLDEFERNYRACGGRRALREYLAERDGAPIFAPQLQANIVWAQYNLATDASFNEFELIMCRDTLAEFGNALKRRTLQLFHDSLPHFGLLSANGIDHPEADTSIAGYTSLDRDSGLFRRVV